MFVVGSIMEEIVNLKTKLVEEFLMKELGPAQKIHGMKISKIEKSGC